MEDLAMNYWTQSKNNIWVAAHRGWCSDYPENTIVTVSVDLTGCLKFDGWYVNGECITGTDDYTFVADKNISIYASYWLILVSLA